MWRRSLSFGGLECGLSRNRKFLGHSFRSRGCWRVLSRGGRRLLSGRISGHAKGQTLVESFFFFGEGRYHDLVEKVLNELFFEGTGGKQTV